MSDIHSIEEAYAAVAVAMNYLEERGEDLDAVDEGFNGSGIIFEGKAGQIVWNHKKKNWESEMH